MPNETNGGGVVTLTVEAVEGYKTSLATAEAAAVAAKAEAAGLRAELDAERTKSGSASLELSGLKSRLDAMEAVNRDREVTDVINAAVADGRIAPGQVEELRADAAEFGIAALRRSLSRIAPGAAGPRRALASGATMPVEARTMTDAEMAGEAHARAKANGTTYREEFRKLRAEKGASK